MNIKHFNNFMDKHPLIGAILVALGVLLVTILGVALK